MKHPFEAIAKFLYETVRERCGVGTLQALLLGALFFPLLFLYLPVGFKLSYVNFTYGVHGLDPEYKTRLPQLFLMVAGFIGLFEVLAHGLIFRQLLKRVSPARAFWIHLAILNGIALPALIYWHWSFGTIGFARGLIYENLLMSFWALLFLKTGSLWITALVHSGEFFLRAVIMNDVTASFETLYFYSSASDDFYGIMLATAFFCVGVMVLLNQKFKMLEVSSPIKHSWKTGRENE